MLLAGLCLEAAAKGGSSRSSYSYYSSNYTYTSDGGDGGECTDELCVILTSVAIGVAILASIAASIYKYMKKKREE